VTRHSWLVAVIAALAIIAGCKGNSNEPGAGANGGSAPTAGTTVGEPSPGGAGPTVTTAAPEPTATSAPTATAAPKVIEVIGDDDFKQWAARALERIETSAPDAYKEVMASIDVIESVPAGSGMYVDERRFAVGDETAHAPGYDEDGQLLWFAGTIVHDAHHSALFIDGEPHTGKDAEVACLAVQKAALELMTSDPFFANYVQGLIDGADDPANQYWNQPNRHW
jgi:hypothetical protein